MGKRKRVVPSFDPDGALKTAVAFDTAAAHLHTTGAPVPLGTALTADQMAKIVGRVAGAVVLEALAIELVLKVRVSRVGKPVPTTHSHSETLRAPPGGGGGGLSANPLTLPSSVTSVSAAA